jgi:hypothetical protein
VLSSFTSISLLDHDLHHSLGFIHFSSASSSREIHFISCSSLLVFLPSHSFCLLHPRDTTKSGQSETRRKEEQEIRLSGKNKKAKERLKAKKTHHPKRHGIAYKKDHCKKTIKMMDEL